ncbi:MAG: peptide/nickel transport system substrate-binding protein [Acidobacteriota bacterium]|jgi:ABC-type transport system substrate-binding protein|nr:peptide/nickel transport system substrate-binding protein [Acidobacteriota bacterium]
MPRLQLRNVPALFILVATLLAGCGGGTTGQKAMRFKAPIFLKINAASAPTRQYASIIQNQLKQVGIPCEIDQVEFNTLLDQQRKGQFQLTTGRWVGGNQDPIYLFDLFHTGAYQNRGRYSNPELDKALEEAIDSFDRVKAKELYIHAQDIISREVPQLPLWYVDQMVVARKNVQNLNVPVDGDWRFLRDVTVDGGKQGPFVVVLESNPETLDQLRGTDASSERFRQLIFNSLVRKDEKFEYVGDLATEIQQSPDHLVYTFKLRDGVKFHNGKAFTSADAKYTLDTLLKSDSRKANDFFEGTGAERRALVKAIETPDPLTLIVRLNKPLTKFLSGLVPVGMMPQGYTTDQQKQTPVGTGAFKFARYDESQQVVDLTANDDYWGGAPAVKQLRVRTILDANTLQAELKSGGIDIAQVANLQPDAYQQLGQDANLKIAQFPGVNVVYLNFNATDEVLKDPRVRQAIAYAIDRPAIVKELLLGQARVANSILPEQSWAYSPGQVYNYDPERARQLLDEAGYKAP